MTIITFLLALLAIFVVVLVHESGHFFVAKAFKIKIARFSIGFGKALWSYHSQSGTEYVLAILPLGGYVKMLDGDATPLSPAELPYTFAAQPIWVRMAVTAAGPLMNGVLAILLFWLIFLQGITDHAPVIVQITPHSLAAAAGLQAGDRILAIDGHSIKGQQELLEPLVSRLGDQGTMTITVQSPASRLPTEHSLALADWKQQTVNPLLLSSLGIDLYSPPMPAIVAKVMPDSPAALGGVLPADEIIQLNQKPINNLVDLFNALEGQANQTVTLIVKRQQQRQTLKLHLKSQQRDGRLVGLLGVYFQEPVWPLSMVVHQPYNMITAWAPAVRQTYQLALLHGVILKKLVTGKIKASETLGGPVSIVRGASSASQQGLNQYLAFMALVSIALGFINILPFPVLDGGHLLLQLIELITRRPVPVIVQTTLWLAGLTALLLLMLVATYYDVMRWITGTN